MQKQDYKGIWIYAEHRNGKLDATVYELLGKAQELKAFCKEEITAGSLLRKTRRSANTAQDRTRRR